MLTNTINNLVSRLIFLPFSFYLVFSKEYKIELLLLFLVGIWFSLWGRITIALLAPLMIIKVVTHLSDCLSCRVLTLNWNFCEARGSIILDVISLKDIFVLFIYLYHFITRNTLIILTFDRTTHLFELLFHPIRLI